MHPDTVPTPVTSLMQEPNLEQLDVIIPEVTSKCTEICEDATM